MTLRKAQKNFGQLLRIYRERTIDPHTQRKLSQTRLGELINVTTATISYWENNDQRCRTIARSSLLQLIQTLHEHGGIATPTEANDLLDAGRYAALNRAEATQCLPGVPYQPSSSSPHQSFNSTVLPLLTIEHLHLALEQSWFSLFPLPETTLAALVLHLLYVVTAPLSAERILRGLGTISLWGAAYSLLIPFLRWPFPHHTAALHATIQYLAGALIIPLFIGTLISPDEEAQLLTTAKTKKARWILRAFKYIGAFIGFHIGFAATFIITLSLHYLEIWNLPRWGQLLLLVPPLMMSYVGVKRLPVDMHTAQDQQWRLTEGDGYVALAFTLLGPLEAGLFYWNYPIILNPRLGIPIFIIATGTAAGALLWQQKYYDRHYLPSEIWVLLFGIPLSLYTLLQNPTEPLGSMLLTSIIILQAIILSHNRATISLKGLLGACPAIMLLYALFHYHLWAGRVGTLFILLLWVTWGRRYLWFTWNFLLLISAGGLCAYLITQDVSPPLSRLLFLCIAGLIINQERYIGKKQVMSTENNKYEEPYSV